MIEKLKNKGIALHTKNTTYALKILKTGHIEHLYYGERIDLDDAGPLEESHIFLPGNTVAYNQEGMKYTLENIRLEMSSYGKGDIREPFVEIVHADGCVTSDFIFKEMKIENGKPEYVTLPGSYDKDGNVEHMTLILEDVNYNVTMELHYYVYENCDVIARSTKLINHGQNSITVKRLMSAQLDMFDSDYQITTFNGAWVNEMNKSSHKLTAGKFVNASYTGTSSSRANPFVIIGREDTREEFGECIGANLIYSGNHYEALEVNAFNKTRFVSGINPTSMAIVLGNGEELEAPEAVLTYSNKGFGGMSRNMHQFVQNHIVRGVWQYRERPILLNSWEANYFDVSEEKLVELAKAGKNAGIELFVLDDGWFGNRNDDTSSLGDWFVNEQKLPHGIKGLADRINDLGLKFGIWIEPEMVNKNSKLYREHSEWTIEVPGTNHSEGRNQCILDLTNPKVIDYLIEEMSNLFESGNISYVKWDMNRIFSDYYSQNMGAENQGSVAHNYVLGFYKLAKTLTEKFPEILFEGCCAGGNRFDLGVLCYFPQIWGSDNTDAICRASIQENYSYGYPMSTVSAHVSACPNHQTLRTTPIDTRYNVACFGILGYECDLTKMTDFELELIKKQISDYKKNRKTLQFGEFYRSSKENVYQWTCVDNDKQKAVGMVLQILSKPNNQHLKYLPKGLEETAKYHLTNREVTVEADTVKSVLGEETVEQINKEQNGILSGESENVTAYGNLLMRAGVNLKEAFAGTGYGSGTRIFTDYSSRLYMITNINP